ncbi:D-alanyl-D-alanine carboxypeptidase [Streptomyces sp. NPDC002734]|uniref:D-alanyl-D-alanine carboxypeptidase family protein n=1 Tax=Streptomyces sp. NPDC002734 TaxID=3154426 RepID=UPI0033176374
MPAPKKTTRRPALLASATLLSLALGLVLPLTAGTAEAKPIRPGSRTGTGTTDSGSPSKATGTPRATSTPADSLDDADDVDDADDSPASSGTGKTGSGTSGKSLSKVGGLRLGAPGIQVQPGVGAPKLPEAELSANSWIVADAESGEVLASYNAHKELAPASTLKMLFADTLLGRWPGTQTHTVTNEDLAGIGAGSSLVGVKEKEEYTVRDLWLGVFLRSGNDAVHVLSAMNGGVDKTVADMNARAEELQALDTHVVSPDGYDAKGQVSSAYDLTLIARSGLQDPDFREYASTVRAQFPGATTKGKGGKKTRGTFEIQNTNRLLTGAGVDQYPGIAGVKNGNTTNAGATFTGVAERDGKVLLVTVMNPKKKELNRVYKETAALLDWGFAASGKVTPVGELVPPASQAAASASADPGASSAAVPAGDHAGAGDVAAAKQGEAGPLWIPLAIVGGVLVLLAGGGFLLHRRWPLPGTGARQEAPTANGSPTDGSEGSGSEASEGADKAADTAEEPKDGEDTAPAADSGKADATEAEAEATGTDAETDTDTSSAAAGTGKDEPAEDDDAAEARMPQQATAPRTTKDEDQPA